MNPPDRSTPWSLLLAVGGTSVLLLGLLTSCLSLSIFFDSGANLADGSALTWLFCFTFIAIPLTLAGVGAIWAAWRRRANEQRRALDAQVVALARAHGGTVSASALSLASPLTFNEAQDFLEGLAARGICRMEMAESGETRFRVDTGPPRLVTTPGEGDE